MMCRLLLLTAALGACDRSSSKQDPVARDLSRAMSPTTNTADTATQRKQAELERCKYVYHDEQGLRECLVVKNGWEPQDAAREIAIYKAEIGRAVDSLQRVRDRLLLAEMSKRRQEAAYAARQPYWGLVATRTYFTNSPNCDTLATFRYAELRFFKTREEAERAGYARTDQPGC